MSLSGIHGQIITDLKSALTTWLMTPEDWADLEEVLREPDLTLDDLIAGLRNFGPQREEGRGFVLAPDSVREPVGKILDRIGALVSVSHSPYAIDSTAADGFGVSPEPSRFVNTLIAASGSDEPVSAKQPLKLGAAYELLVGIGAPRDGSLLIGEAAEFSDSLLPDGDLQLRAVLTPGADGLSVVVPFTLPAEGNSFACSCPPDHPHRAECERLLWVRFALPLPEVEGVWQASLIIYYQVVAVHAQELTLTMGGLAGGSHAEKTYGLTTSFSNLRGLSDRTASVLVSSDAARLTLNGVSFMDSPVTMNRDAANSAIRDARNILYDIHFEPAPGSDPRAKYSRFDHRFGKNQQEFQNDLEQLARIGRQIYTGIFKSDLDTSTKMRRLLRQEARVRERPPRICLLEPHAVQSGSSPTIPWSLVYDLPLKTQPPYKVCQSVKEFGPGGQPPAVIPAHCPYSDHLGPEGFNVLCAFGFWGLACEVEQPPSVATDAVALVNAADVPKALFFAASPDPDSNVTSIHLDKLAALLGDTTVSPLPTGAELAAALQDEDMDVAYLYCHCGYHQINPHTTPTAYLDVGGQLVDPFELQSWAEELWPKPHWPSRKPLVVLNGCHTAEMTSSTLATFVDSFVGIGGAAGMIGTEVTLEKGLAAAFMEQFLSRFAQGERVGSALRASRWEFLSRGNVMGLAYTPYCLSSLRIRAVRKATHPGAN